MAVLPLLLQAILLAPLYFMLMAVVLQPIYGTCLIIAAAVTWFFSTLQPLEQGPQRQDKDKHVHWQDE